MPASHVPIRQRLSFISVIVYAFRAKCGSTVVLFFVGGRRKHSIKKIVRKTSTTTSRKLGVTVSVMDSRTIMPPLH